MGKEHPMRQGPVVRPRHSQKLDDPKKPTGHSNYGSYNPHENWIVYHVVCHVVTNLNDPQKIHEKSMKPSGYD